jgi:acyl phosphate:glycerol-3-phosphate acyltransferase
MIEFLLKIVFAYLLGSVVGSLVIRPYAGGVDIRTLGSGNAGATNALRTLGRRMALVVFAIDVLKGWVATALLAPWPIPFLPGEGALYDWTVPACGLAVILGHIYPVFFGFRGGKGMATLLGAVLGMSVRLIAPMILTFLILVMVFGFVSLGTMAAVLALVLTALFERRGPPLVLFAILTFLLIVYTHRANIARIRAGNESRARRLWLMGLVRSQG